MSKIQFPPDTTGARIGMTEILEKRAEMDSFCRVILGDDCLGSVTAPVAKTYNGDPDFADIAHPVESFFRKAKEHSASSDLQEIDQAWDELIADGGWTPEKRLRHRTVRKFPRRRKWQRQFESISRRFTKWQPSIMKRCTSAIPKRWARRSPAIRTRRFTKLRHRITRRHS